MMLYGTQLKKIMMKYYENCRTFSKRRTKDHPQKKVFWRNWTDLVCKTCINSASDLIIENCQ